LQQVLITEYAAGAAIGWHLDKPVFEDVVAISFLAPCTLRLRRRHEEGWERRSIELMPPLGLSVARALAAGMGAQHPIPG
jgi:alkylated DNA repair dioxygenase AlkB